MTKTKAPALLTVPQATKQARRHVDRLMPGVMATVESKLSHDLDTNTPLVITTVTFPRNHEGRHLLVVNLATLAGFRSLIDDDSSIRMTRER